MIEAPHPSSGPRNSTTALRVAATAERQLGVVTWSQLRKCGMSAPAISRALTAGRLHRIHPGVYAVGHRALPIEGHLTAALLHAGPGAALSHTTAGWWWGVLPNQPSVIHVSVPHRRRLGPGIKVHQPRQLVRVFHRGLPVRRFPEPSLTWPQPCPFTRFGERS